MPGRGGSSDRRPRCRIRVFRSPPQRRPRLCVLSFAQVGDLFMSLVHTCELAGANPFDYLTELQRHRAALAVTPAAWMPWNYRDTLATLTAASQTDATGELRRRAGRIRWFVGGSVTPRDITTGRRR